MINSKIPVVIPSYEPDDCLVSTCETLILSGIKNIIVVNDGSNTEYDRYFNAVEGLDVVVLTHTENRGKGRALKTAFEYILKEMPDSIGCITADSDGQHSQKDIMNCMNALTNNPNSLILGCRDFSGDNVPAKSKFGNELTKKICSFLCGVKVSDTQTGLRGIPIKFMAELLYVKGERFEFETYMLIQTKERYQIFEVKIDTIYDSPKNHKTHFNPIKDSIRIYKIFAGIFLKYIVSSVSSFLLDLFLFTLFSKTLKPSYPFLYVTLATVFARLISSTYNCLVNYRFVFRSKNKITWAIFKYFILVAVQMCLSAFFVTVGVKIISFVPDVIVKMVVDTILFFGSYYFQRRFIF
ncbi:MAG: bifunctional glycosyltransferase family 2/GtrA family protein [Clostridia bacterium]|nr:bifunctional glycosyltransferase family 2/GtrA family protein [Clostridia bacterium]